jgi:hypothetical protein
MTQTIITTKQSLEILSRKKKANQQKLKGLLQDAFRHQATLCNSLGEATYAALCVGRSILACKPLLEHGEHQSFVLQHFCEPLQVDLRTVQRYCALAKSMDSLCEKIHSGEIEVKDFDERTCLQGLGFAEARDMVRHLLNGDEGQNRDSSTKMIPQPDRNDWSMPEDIVSRCLDLLSVVNVDPFCIPQINTFDAETCVTRPSDGLSNEYPWKGNMVLNPGFHQTQLGDVAHRLVTEYLGGNVQQAITLLPACLKSHYAQILREFPRVFINQDLKVRGPTVSTLIKTPLMLVYVGQKQGAFFKAFNHKHFDAFVPFKSTH